MIQESVIQESRGPSAVRWVVLAWLLASLALSTDCVSAQDNPAKSALVVQQEELGPVRKESAAAIPEGLRAAGKDGPKAKTTDAPKRRPEPEKAKNQSSQSKKASSSIRLSLPNTAPDGERLEAVGVFQSQLVDLIPPGYRPIGIEPLAKAIRRSTSDSAGGRDARLISSVYDVRLVRDTLISDRSTIEILANQDGVVRASLGEVNFAVTPLRERSTFATGTMPSESFPRLEATADGRLIAVIRGETQRRNAQVSFSWSYRGLQTGLQREYRLKIPRSNRTQIILSTPGDVIASSTDGVLRSWPGPPPGADVDLRSSDVRWYTIDAGGLAEVTIRTKPTIVVSQAPPIVVREETRSYEVTESGIQWRHALTIQSPGGARLPEFQVPNGAVTGVYVNGSSLQFGAQVMNDSSQSITVDVPLGGSSETSNAYRVAVTGSATWDGITGWGDLPTANWKSAIVIAAQATANTQLIVRRPLNLVSWNLPTQWTQQPRETISNAEGGLEAVVFRAEGPPMPRAEPATSNASSWSRVRLATQEPIRSSEIWTQLKINTNSSSSDRRVEAKTRIKISLQRNSSAPIRLLLQPRWALQTITAVHSGRVIETPSVNNNGSILIWPEPQDVQNSQLLIDAVGVLSFPSARQGTQLPACWFLRPRDVRNHLLVAIVPPSDLNWSGETSLKASQVDSQVLSDEQVVFFDELNDDSLLFRPESNVTPELSLKRPSVSVKVQTSLHFERVDDEIIETLNLSADSGNQLVREITVRTGAANSRPLYRWSLRSMDDSPPINLPSTDIQSPTDGEYTIALRESSLRGQYLVGRRRYPLTENLSVLLPSVANSAMEKAEVVISQEAEVLLGEGLDLGEVGESGMSLPDSVQRVPLENDATNMAARTNGSGTMPFTSRQNESAAIRLRYDPIEQSTVTIAKSDADPSVSIVWLHKIELTASSRGTDLVEGLFKVSSAQPLRIDHEPDLQLVSITQNDIAIDLATISERPIVLDPKSPTDTIKVVWSRERFKSGFFRRCRIPFVRMNGVHVKSSYRMSASADTFALAALLHSATEFESSGVDVSPATTNILIHRDLALAFGWLLALIVFVVAWMMARRNLTHIAICVSIATISALLWWPWQIAIIGWLIFPMIAAALLESSIQWGTPGKRAEMRRDSETLTTQSVLSQTDDSADFSFSNGLPLWLLIASSCCFGHSYSQAMQPPANSPETKSALQSDEEENALERSSRVIHVLVPIDENAKQVGDKVYVPTPLHRQLFKSTLTEAPSTVTFLSANYQINLGGERVSQVADGEQTVDVDYQVQVNGTNNVVVLPIPPAQLIGDRLRVRSGDQDRLVLTTPRDSESVIATFPSESNFRVRASLRATSRTTNDRTIVTLQIPRIASSRLTVDADRAVKDIKILTSAGEISRLFGLQRLDAKLGPIASLQMEYQTEEVGATETAVSPVCRYWVNAGKNRTTVDCQVEPPAGLAVGDTIDLVVLDSRLPDVHSATWRLLPINESETGTESVFGSDDGSSTRRRRITLVKLADSAAPIHLIWSLDSIVNDATSIDDRVPMDVPTVLIPGGYEVESWFAVQSDPGIQVSRAEQDLVGELTTQRFLQNWVGFQPTDRIGQTFIATEQIPSFVFLQSQTPGSTADVMHHLHIRRDQVQLRLRGMIKPSESVVQHKLQIPGGFDLVRLTVDGKLIDEAPVRAAGQFEVAIGDFSGSAPVSVEALCVAESPEKRRMNLPAINIIPATTNSGVYSLTRSVDVRVKVTREPDALLQKTALDNERAMLGSGWVPVATWNLTESTDDSEPAPWSGQITIGNRSPKFDYDQTIDVSYEDGGWSMKTAIAFAPKSVPDFIDVEIPSRWCESLDVQPATIWTQAASTDPLTSVIRIACDAERLPNSTLTITSNLAASDQGRVTVPRIEILGVPSRSITVSIPPRLTNNPIIWKPSAQTRSLASEPRPRFLVDANAWPIELAASSDAKSEPIAVAADARVFVQNEMTLVICRWDIVPYGTDVVYIRLPPGAECLGAWTANAPAKFFFPDSTAQPQYTNSIRVPLSLSRLAQSVEVMLSVPTVNTRRRDYLPELIDIIVPEHWVTMFSTPEAAPADAQIADRMRNSIGLGSVTADEMRAVMLAKSVVDSIDQSLDTLAERPADEVATWLMPWMVRYQNISGSTGRRFDITQAASSEDSDVELSSQLATMTPTLVRQLWQRLDNKMKSHAARFLNETNRASVGQLKPLFDVRSFEGYQLTDIHRVSPLAPAKPIQAMSSQMHDLRLNLLNLLTLAMVGGILVLLKPFEELMQRVCRHPASWLGAVGAFSLFVVSIPIAIVLILLAIGLWKMPVNTIRRLRSRLG